ncbi:MAG TPA: hypothetical protein VJ596_11260, partial [Gemmatimonadaceae bacterium]|nr:hypothetical protein [Gemmatimonadaceae bacterium]
PFPLQPGDGEEHELLELAEEIALGHGDNLYKIEKIKRAPDARVPFAQLARIKNKKSTSG